MATPATVYRDGGRVCFFILSMVLVLVSILSISSSIVV